MSRNAAAEDLALVNEIVQRVLLRLSESNDAGPFGNANQVQDESEYEFSGRLLTVGMLDGLSLKRRLKVARKCVVTPEAVDELHRRGVKLVRHGQPREIENSKLQAARSSSGLVPQKLKTWEWVPETIQQSRKSCLEQLSSSTRVFSCYESLVDSLIDGDRASEGLHLVAAFDALQLQREMNRRGLFAPVANPASIESIETVTAAKPEIILVQVPLASWGLKRLVRAWSQAIERRVDK